MRPYHALFGAVLFFTSSGALGQPQPLGNLWQSNRGAVFLTECPPGDHDESCRAVKVRRGNDVVDLGGGYIHVTLLWSRQAKVGGPDVLILGDDGGSGDLYAVTLSPRVGAQARRRAL